MKQSFLNYVYEMKLELFIFLLAIFAPITTNLIFIGVLIFGDTLTGVWAAKKKGGWTNVQSRPLADGLVPKLILYPFILIISSSCQHLFHDIPFIKGATFILMLIETKSITENLTKILGINLFKYFKILITKGRNGLVDEITKEEK